MATTGSEQPYDATIIDVLPGIVNSQTHLHSIRLHTLSMVPQTDTRVVDLPEVRPLTEEALALRRNYRIPFWEAILLLARREGGPALELVLDAANHHQQMAGNAIEIELGRSEVTSQKLAAICSELKTGQVLAISSRVAATEAGKRAHIPLLDFRIRPNRENQELAIGILRRIGTEGLLFNSGNSYHFYGRELLSSDAELGAFLGRAALFAPFVDQRWIAHQMIENSCALRISSGKEFSMPPTLVAEVTR